MALLVIVSTVALALGVLLRQPAMMGANDISRWCTVWSLLERGTYVIDECPWQIDTQDKVYRARERSRGAEPAKHYYSSKPALLSTLIAGVLYPARQLTGVPLDRVVIQEREERWVQKPDENNPGKVKGVLERPKDPAKWPAYVFYFKTALVLLNIVPFAIFLVLYARVLDRYASNDWAWFFSLMAAAVGTYLLPFTQTLNNHTVAAFSAFFALYLFLRIWDEGKLSGWRFAGVGLFAAFTAVNEIPALAFAALVAGLLLLRYPRKTLLWLVPGLLVPFAASVATQYAALGEVKLVYTEFGTESYLWEGSLWKTPLELDALNLPWFDPREAARRGIGGESYGLYLFHMTLGHHGFWSLTPIFFFSVVGLVRLVRGAGLVADPPRRGAADGGGGMDDGRADRCPAGLLHVEPQGTELRRLDAGPALALLADPVLAPAAASRRGRRPESTLGSQPVAPGPGDLGPFGWLLHAQPMDPPVDPRRPRAPGGLYPAPLNAVARAAPCDRRPGLRRRGHAVTSVFMIQSIIYAIPSGFPKYLEVP